LLEIVSLIFFSIISSSFSFTVYHGFSRLKKMSKITVRFNRENLTYPIGQL
jgi:hypothetical protein